MEKMKKAVFWLLIASIGCIVLGAIFGFIAIGTDASSGSNVTTKSILIAIVLVVTIVEVISTIIALLSTRKNEIKTSILSIGRNSNVETLAVLTAFFLSVLGLCSQNPINGTMMGILITTFLVALFASSLIVNTLKGFRKDKENYGYCQIVSFIAFGALILFGIVALISCIQLNSNTAVPGLLSAFALLFVVADALSFLSLAFLSRIAVKTAPKVTMADADAAVLTGMNETLQEIKKAQNNSTTSNNGNFDKLREYKKLLDEGVITQEDYDAKKKELL